MKPNRVLYSQTLLLSVERAWMAAASFGKFMVFSGGEYAPICITLRHFDANTIDRRNIGGVSTAVDIFNFISPLNIAQSTNTLTNPRSRHAAACIQTSTEILYLIAGGVSSLQA